MLIAPRYLYISGYNLIRQDVPRLTGDLQELGKGQTFLRNV